MTQRTIDYITPLNNSASYTSNNLFTEGYSSFVVSWTSDVVSSLVVQQSCDAVNWDILDTTAGVASAGNVLTVLIKSRWVRLVLTNNSGVNQTYIRLYAVLETTGCCAGQNALSIYRNLNVSGTGYVIKASAGKLYKIHITNTNGSTASYFRVYDKSTTPASTDTPKLTFRVSPSSIVDFDSHGAGFANGISIRATCGSSADNDTTVAGISTFCNITYA